MSNQTQTLTHEDAGIVNDAGSVSETTALPEAPPSAETPSFPAADAPHPDAPYAAQLPVDSAGTEPPAGDKRRRGGVIAAFVGGSVLALALAFGGGVAVGATAFGNTSQTAPGDFTPGDGQFPGDGQPPQGGFGGGPGGDLGQQSDTGTESGESS